MNKFFWLGVLALVAVPVSAESVSAVSFNPSRLGDYDYLKVSGSAKLPGGLRTSTLDINTAGQVTIQNVPSKTQFSVSSIKGNNAQVTLSFPNAVIYKQKTNPDAVLPLYDASTRIAPSGVTRTNLSISGGTLDVSNSERNDSFVASLQNSADLPANSNLKQYVKNLYVPNARIDLPEDRGLAEGAIRLLDSNLNNALSTPGFTLGSTKIFYPSNVVYKTSEDGTTTHSSLDLSDANCQLKWVKRRISTSSQTDQQYAYVLAMQGCSPTCVSGTKTNTITESCPSGWQGTQTVQAQITTTCNSENGMWEEGTPSVEYKKTDGTWTSDVADSNIAWNRSGCSRYAWQKEDHGWNEGYHLGAREPFKPCSCTLLRTVSWYGATLGFIFNLLDLGLDWISGGLWHGLTSWVGDVIEDAAGGLHICNAGAEGNYNFDIDYYRYDTDWLGHACHIKNDKYTCRQVQWGQPYQDGSNRTCTYSSGQYTCS